MKLQRRRVLGFQAREVVSAWRAFRGELAGQGVKIALALGMSIVVTGLELLRPWPIKLVVDRLGASTGEAGVDRVIVVAAVIACAVPLLIGSVNFVLTMTVARVARKATVRIRQKVFMHLQRLELVEHQRQYTGDLLMRLMGDVNLVRDVLFVSWINVVTRLLTFTVTLVVLVLVDPLLALGAALPLPLLWVRTVRTTREVRDAASKARRKEGRLASNAAESLRQVALTKAFAAEEAAGEAFAGEARSAERATMRSALLSARMNRLTEGLTGAGTGLVLILGVWRAASGHLTAGTVVVALSYVQTLYKPLRKLSNEGPRLGKATASANRIVDLLERPAEVSAGPRAPRFDGAVSFLHVSHTYPDGRRSLNDLTLHVNAGELVVVCGDNGSGKSTLVQLLLRLYRPDEGYLLVDGQRADRWAIDSYRNQLAYVPQNLQLWGGTIRENIVFGTPEWTDEQVAEAIELARLGPVIAALPDGIDTELIEHGSSLSGGQARRLMLARAALRDASIVLLDEPLAALDPEARSAVAGTIRGIARGRTTIVVNHGPVDELAPDRVIELSGGRIVGARARRVDPTVAGDRLRLVAR